MKAELSVTEPFEDTTNHVSTGSRRASLALVSEFVTHRCRMCEGVAHPATGCVYSPSFIVCWRCTLEFARWLETWTHSKGRRRGPAFYDHVQSPAPK